MNFFKHSISNTTATGLRLKGLPRLLELVDRDFKRFFFINLFTLFGFLPLIAGIVSSILLSSVLILIPACILGGAIAGPFLACLYDSILRSLRDVSGKWTKNYKKAMKQNWKQSILPGIIFGLLFGFYLFMLAMFLWAKKVPTPGTIFVYILGLLIIMMFFSLYWPQLVLFEQTQKLRMKNCLLFFLQFFWKTLGCCALIILYWIVMFLFLPWSILLLFLGGIWFILFIVTFLLYDNLNNAFQIEQQIAQVFPEQAAFYEDDETWLKRKQKENANMH